MMRNFHKRGITFIEILVVVAILGILTVIVLPSFTFIRDNQILKTSASDVFSALDRARSQALSSVNSSEYGVHFESSKIVIFKGMTYSSSDPSNEDIFIFSPAYISTINLTGGATDLYFDRLSGVPNTTGSVTISISSLSKVVTISTTGAVSMN